MCTGRGWESQRHERIHQRAFQRACCHQRLQGGAQRVQPVGFDVDRGRCRAAPDHLMQHQLAVEPRRRYELRPRDDVVDVGCFRRVVCCVGRACIAVAQRDTQQIGFHMA